MHIAITGASSGIGAAIARGWDAPGNRLSLVARRLDRLEALAAEVGCEAASFRADLADLDSCTAWVAEAEAANGPIDVLVNNAGIQYVERGLGVSDERSERMFAVNLLAPIRLCRLVGSAMAERGSGGIVNIASMAGITWTPWMAHYSATKSGLGSYSETLAFELRPRGVNVLTVYPGPVKSDMEAAAKEQLVASKLVDVAPTGTPEQLAALIRGHLARGRTRLIYPRIYGPARWFWPFAQWVTAVSTPKLRG